MAKKSGNGRLEKIIATIRGASQGNLTVRLDTSKKNDQLDSLAAAVNDLMDSLSKEIAPSGQAGVSFLEKDPLLSSIFWQNPYPIWISDDKGTLVRINQACCDMLNIRPEEVIGKYNVLQDNLVKEQGHLPLVQSVFDKGRTVEFSIEYDSAHLKSLDLAQSSFVILDVTIFPIKDKNGIITNAVIIHHDITRRKLLEEELNFFRFSIENATDAVFWLDRHGQITYVNDQACSSLGYTRDELLCLYLWDIDSAFPRERWSVVWEEDARVGQRLLETTHRHKNGTLFPVEVSASHIKLNGKEHHVAFVRDITERKKAVEGLRESEEKYRSVVDNINMGIVLIGPDMKVLSANSYAKKTFPHIDFEKHPLCFKAFNCPPRDEPCGYCATIKTLKDGEVHETITETPSKDGVRNFRIISSPVRDNAGKVVSVVEIAEDITDKKRIEDERKKLEEQLIQAQKMEALGTMAGGIAHDFNNILSIIFGYTELAMDDVPAGSAARDKLTQVINASTRARDLVKQILSFSRKGDQEPQPISPHTIVKETLKLLRATIPTTIEIQQGNVKESGTIIADPIHFHQILMNLAMNAVHAMSEDGILSVSLKRTTLDKQDLLHRKDMVEGPYVELSISDTGKGIHPEVIDHVFEPFFTTKDVGEGTGMGLSVVHGIVLAHHGLVKVESKLGQGTTFRVYLPAAEKEEVLFAESVVSFSRGTERILFVDDEPELAALGQEMLESLGYKVTYATGSIQALQIFSSQSDEFDLIITDQTMPKMSGLELIREIRNINKAIPVILCTGYSSKVTNDLVSENLFQELIIKPFNKSLLATTVRRVMDGQAV